LPTDSEKPSFPLPLLEKVRTAPVDAGCYLYRDKSAKIIYIGKAKNLRNRVKSYFTATRERDPKTQTLLRRIQDVEFVTTHSEVEALILENTLIKKHKPKYNIFLKDDKTFPYVQISNEPFPRVVTTRRPVNDGSEYFGPFTNVREMKNTVKILNNLFAIRSCQHKLDTKTVAEKRIKLCLDYHIHKCEGPCQGLISEKEYDRIIEKAKAFLEGKTQGLLTFFQQQMEKASREFRFEDAARFRDQLEILRSYGNRQAVELNDFADRDFIQIVSDESSACAMVFRVREGKLLGKDSFFLDGVKQQEPAIVLRDFLQRYYTEAFPIPPEIDVSLYPEQVEVLEEWLTLQRGSGVRITKPARIDKIRLLRMVEKNARYQLQDDLLKKLKRSEYTPKSLKELQRDLQLEKLPKCIEAFDISMLHGKSAVGSLVVFQNARAAKKEYRRFRIKSKEASDDFSMMAEVVRRRYTRLLAEKKKLPDLVLIDGGEAQARVAQGVLRELQINEELPVIGIAKRLEVLHWPGKQEPVLLPRNSTSLRLLQKIRDESHRFAITYHRKVRKNNEIRSELDRVPGLGKMKQKALWTQFKTIYRMKSASVEEFEAVAGIGPKLAQSLWNFLHKA